jgi:transcriptional regulator with XRE-family HTH domain
MLPFRMNQPCVIEKHYRKISKNVKKMRLNKKMTQEAVALAMGFTTAAFYTNAENFKRGKHFNLEHIIKLSYILKCDISELVSSSEDEIESLEEI